MKYREGRERRGSLPFERLDNRASEAKEGEHDPQELEPLPSSELDYLSRRTFE